MKKIKLVIQNMSKGNWINKIEEIRKISFTLPNNILGEVEEHAQEIGKTVEEIISQSLWKMLKEWFVEYEKRKEIWHIIWNLSIEELESEVLDFLRTDPSEFAFWSEAKIYKMHIPWKKEDVLIIKRKYKWTSTEEFDIHNLVKNLEFSSKKDWINTNVHIPALFHHFNKNGEEYILMEYIKWKTLYLMIIEAILSQETIEYWEKIKDINRKKEFYYIYYSLFKNKKLWDLDLNDFYKLNIWEIKELLSDGNWFLKEIEIESDLHWEKILKYLYLILKEEGIINIDIDSQMDLWWLKINKFLFDLINRKDFSNLSIFTNSQALYLSKNINSFLSYMHKNWIYHRDLWSNTRNIILQKQEDWLYKPTIIDFWKSKVFDSMVDNIEAYIEENVDWSFTRYVNDEMIVIKYIEKLSWEKKEWYKLIDKQKEIILNDLLEIWKKYWVKLDDIKSSFNSISRYKNVVYFDRLTEILFNREVIWWYKLNLSKTKKADLIKEREEDKSKVLADIITLMYFLKEENFNKVMSFIWNLKLDNNFNPPLKKEYIDLYSNIFIDVSKKRKN